MDSKELREKAERLFRDFRNRLESLEGEYKDKYERELRDYLDRLERLENK